MVGQVRQSSSVGTIYYDDTRVEVCHPGQTECVLHTIEYITDGNDKYRTGGFSSKLNLISA